LRAFGIATGFGDVWSAQLRQAFPIHFFPPGTRGGDWLRRGAGPVFIAPLDFSSPNQTVSGRGKKTQLFFQTALNEKHQVARCPVLVHCKWPGRRRKGKKNLFVRVLNHCPEAVSGPSFPKPFVDSMGKRTTGKKRFAKLCRKNFPFGPKRFPSRGKGGRALAARRPLPEKTTKKFCRGYSLRKGRWRKTNLIFFRLWPRGPRPEWGNPKGRPSVSVPNIIPRIPPTLHGAKYCSGARGKAIRDRGNVGEAEHQGGSFPVVFVVVFCISTRSWRGLVRPLNPREGRGGGLRAKGVSGGELTKFFQNPRCAQKGF